MQPRKISPLNLVDTIGCNDENIYYYYGSSLTHTPYQMQASHNKCTFEGTMRKDSFYSNARGNQVANLDGKKCAVIFIGDRLGRLTRNGFNFHFSLEAKRLCRFTIIMDLKSCDWNKQNPAMEKFNKLQPDEIDKHRQFIIGRNILQASNDAFGATSFIENLDSKRSSVKKSGSELTVSNVTLPMSFSFCFVRA
jgi:hypothetical protein